MSCLIYFWLQIIQPTYIIKDIKIMAKMRLNIRNDKFCLSQDLVSFVDTSKITLSKIFDKYALNYKDIITFINKNITVKVNINACKLNKEYNWATNVR